jgi:hypothetical protein
MTVSKQQREYYNIFAQHGSGDSLVKISPNEVVLLIHIASNDLLLPITSRFLPQYVELGKKDFYEISPLEIDNLDFLTEQDALEFLEISGATNPSDIIFLYLKNLCELYRHRCKFLNILKHHPFPLIEQISPRCLIEYGNCESNLLFSWMCWRKWIYDIDNRSAQETGYLFEPILASCLGGVTVSHRNSPVKRLNDAGVVTTDGRQIDCYIEDKSEVYELKLRVTTAASGQGRLNEEMSFPVEVEHAGLIPILIVFDSTPSIVLDKLKKQYVDHGGHFAVGTDAWDKLISCAGKEMGIFMDKYIRPPIEKIGETFERKPSPISLEVLHDVLIIRDDKGERYIIKRQC